MGDEQQHRSRTKKLTPKPRLRPAPGIAGRLIELANSIPGKLEFPELVDLFTSGALSETDKRGREVDPTRIRQCPVCNTIFWAGRSDKECCSRRCGHTLAGRRYRE